MQTLYLYTHIIAFHHGPGLYPAVPLVSQTWPTSTAHEMPIVKAMILKFTLANSDARTTMCFLARISRQSMPAKDAEKAVLNAPKFKPIARL